MAAPGCIQHMVFEVTDLERSKQFYQRYLGLDPVGETPWAERQPNFALRTRDGDYVVLVEVPTPRPDAPKVHTGFSIDADEFRELLPHWRERFGKQVLSDQKLGGRAAGEIAAYFSDPDGHALQVTVWAPEEGYEVPAAKRGRVDAGPIDSFPVGSVTYVRQGRFYLVRTADGVLAINEVCTHQRCRITYQAEHYRYFCACHGRRFTRTGAVIGQNFGFDLDTAPLHVYPIEFVAGHVVVDTDTTCPRGPDEVDRPVPVPADPASAAS